MSTIKIKNEQGIFVNIPVIQGEKGDNGVDGTSITCIKVNSEQEAIEQSTANPNNVYYW